MYIGINLFYNEIPFNIQLKNFYESDMKRKNSGVRGPGTYNENEIECFLVVTPRLK